MRLDSVKKSPQLLFIAYPTDYDYISCLSFPVVAVAQLVEHRIVIPSVAGSTPVGHPKFCASKICLYFRFSIFGAKFENR